MRSLHLVDMDHTLVRVNLSYEFGKHLFKRGVFSFHQACSFLFYYKTCRCLKTLHEKIFPILFKGIKKDVFTSLSDAWIASYLDSVLNRDLLNFLLEKQKRDERVLLCSSSPHFLVAAVAAKLGILHGIGTEYAVDEQGIFTHIQRVMDGKQKAVECSKVQTSYVYTDSQRDLPALEACTYPIGVRPDKKLRKICMQRGWDIYE